MTKRDELIRAIMGMRQCERATAITVVDRSYPELTPKSASVQTAQKKPATKQKGTSTVTKPKQVVNEFDGRVRAKIGCDLSRREAIEAPCREDPALHERLIEETNRQVTTFDTSKISKADRQQIINGWCAAVRAEMRDDGDKATAMGRAGQKHPGLYASYQDVIYAV